MSHSITPETSENLKPVRFWGTLDRVLRSRAAESAPLALRPLMFCTIAFGLCYGAVMGSFSGLEAARCQLLLYSAIKVPVLILGAFVLSIPSFYVLNTLLGLRQDFPAAVRALAATQAGLTIILASLAPFTGLWYLSFTRYSQAVAFNGVMFTIASASAQLVLRRHYSALIAANRRHLWMLRTWLILYSFVAIQLAWILRPFVGDPRSPPEFVRADVFSENAYVVVARLAWRFVFGD